MKNNKENNHSPQVGSEIVSHGEGSNALHKSNQTETPSEDTFERELEKDIRRLEKYGDEKEYYKQDILKTKLEGYKKAKKDFMKKIDEYRLKNCGFIRKDCKPDRSVNCQSCSIIFKLKKEIVGK